MDKTSIEIFLFRKKLDFQVNTIGGQFYVFRGGIIISLIFLGREMEVILLP